MCVLLRYECSVRSGKECDEEINGNRDKGFAENVEIRAVRMPFSPSSKLGLHYAIESQMTDGNLKLYCSSGVLLADVALCVSVSREFQVLSLQFFFHRDRICGMRLKSLCYLPVTSEGWTRGYVLGTWLHVGHVAACWTRGCMLYTWLPVGHMATY
jgi:hypothetical protein